MKHSTQVNLYLTEEEKELLQREAKRLGMTMSTWLRMTLRQRLGMLAAAEAVA